MSAMPQPPRQLALALDHAESYAREDFFVGPSNEAPFRLVCSWPDWPANALAVIGPEGSGKTHLAMIWAEMAGARIIAARALRDADVPNALATGALVVEDAGGDADDRALFHLINLAREEKASLLFTARIAPAAWPVTIPDLLSRLRALPVTTLQAPDDSLLRAVIVKLAIDRQLALDESVVTFIATRIERSFTAARAAVIALDNEALRQRRAPTRALAAEILRDA
jgi:chromosomal replication initiation ATPase DnaA